MNEGNTPLIYSSKLSRGLRAEVYLKYEGLNPTGSFKDRGMTLAISRAKQAGAKAVICASTGNTSASASAYAGRAGLRSIVLVPRGGVALGKLSQALIHGATVLEVKGNFDTALSLVREISRRRHITLVNSINPYRIEGQKTAAFEICDQLGKRAPDFQVMPVGNAGNITAYWKGYKEYKEKAVVDSLPRMLGFQAEGAAPIARGCVVRRPQTLATAIRIGNPASWRQAEAARDESGGLIDTVSDSEILQAYEFLAREEGVFVEPASAAAVAGLLKLANRSYFKKIRNTRIVCILTGHGLKDPGRAIKMIKRPRLVAARVEEIIKQIGL